MSENAKRKDFSSIDTIHSLMEGYPLDKGEGIHPTMEGYPLSNGEGIHCTVEDKNKYNNKDKNKEEIKDNNNVVNENHIKISKDEMKRLCKEYPESLVVQKLEEYKAWFDKVKPKNIKSDYEQLRKWLSNSVTTTSESMVQQYNVDEVSDEELKNINF